MTLAAPFRRCFGRPPAVLARAPGRVNLLGGHVDYNGGAVLPAAINRYARVAAAPLEGAQVHLCALDLGEQVRFSLEALETRRGLDGAPLPRWARYPAGVAWALRQAGLPVCGMQAVFASRVPMGAGLSSSAAVELAFAAAWQALGHWGISPLRLAQLCQRAESGYAGVHCGLMDQFASACGVAGHALYFDTRSLAWEALPLPPGTCLVVADSGVRRALADSAYNERQLACAQAAALLGAASLRGIAPAGFERRAASLPPAIRRRARHVVEEMARVEAARQALRRGDAAALGALMRAGHASLRDLYEVSTPELDALVEIAGALPGCYGARLTGAGFGGCTVNLVEASRAARFAEALHAGYRARTGRAARLYRCRAVSGARARLLR